MRLIILVTLGAIALASTACSDMLSVVPLDCSENPEACARYRLTFDATWSSETHPVNFPGSAHFSGLIGATHDESFSLWEPGELASPGIESMAETGGKGTLAAEAEAEMGTGVSQVLSGGGIGSSPGQRTLEFDISEDAPLVSITSMIAPSPDWFVGVHGLLLFVEDEWVEEEVVTLYAYDAGTDSGATYTSGNDNTDPQEVITRIEELPFVDGEEMLIPVGTFTFTRIDAAE